MSKTPNIQYPIPNTQISTPQAAIRAWTTREEPPMSDYVITNPSDPAYHRRDPGRTGRLLCGKHYLLGIDEFLSAPPTQQNPMPRLRPRPPGPPGRPPSPPHRRRKIRPFSPSAFKGEP
jgi:hypothetical protein